MNKKNLEEEIETIMLEWDNGNFTVCPECRVDDFCHIEGCSIADNDILSRLADFVLSKLNEEKKE